MQGIFHVSIHAPGRGATGHAGASRRRKQVSIHAPGRGATLLVRDGRSLRLVSIHAPGRGATSILLVKRALDGVSIHAPGRGATTLTPSESILTPSFNSRTREGCDYSKFSEDRVKRKFQFTHPGGVRLVRGDNGNQTIISFNSRTREGCDDNLSSAGYLPGQVSIHAPGRGATPLVPQLLVRYEVSIHAPGRGATALGNIQAGNAQGFNSRTREGCDH